MGGCACTRVCEAWPRPVPASKVLRGRLERRKQSVAILRHLLPVAKEPPARGCLLSGDQQGDRRNAPSWRKDCGHLEKAQGRGRCLSGHEVRSSHARVLWKEVPASGHREVWGRFLPGTSRTVRSHLSYCQWRHSYTFSLQNTSQLFKLKSPEGLGPPCS